MYWIVKLVSMVKYIKNFGRCKINESPANSTDKEKEILKKVKTLFL